MTTKQIIITALFASLLVLYSTGILQFALFGDFTYRMGHTFNIQEDDPTMNNVFATRWKIIHVIDQF